MANTDLYSPMSKPSARETSLSFKRDTQGLTPEEEAELKQLQSERKMRAAGFNVPSSG